MNPSAYRIEEDLEYDMACKKKMLIEVMYKVTLQLVVETTQPFRQSPALFPPTRWP